jgi:hypothetical protein
MKYALWGLMWMMLAVIPWAWCAGNEPKIQLRNSVEVNRERVWLLDLLPPAAPSWMQKASAAIALCPAPQPGSPRILDEEQIATKLAALPELLRQLSIPSRIMVRHAGWPIEEAPVRLAISRFLNRQAGRRDLPDAAKLEWQSLSAIEEHPALQVTGLDWDSRQQSAQFRLRCSTRASCGSFLVHVVLPTLIGEEWQNQLASGVGLKFPGPGAHAAAPTTGVVLAERGKPANLILEDGNIRISLRVICLQPGVLNQEIRVFDAQSRHVFRAEVVGAALLHAAL